LNAKDVSPNPARWNGPVKGLLSKKRADVKRPRRKVDGQGLRASAG